MVNQSGMHQSVAPLADGAVTVTVGQECVEHGIWTPIPVAPPSNPDAFIVKFSHVDPTQHARIKDAGKMTFHMLGCSGDYEDHTAQQQVANVMVPQATAAGTLGLPNGPAVPASFLFHLGDVSYKPDPTGVAATASGTTSPDGTAPPLDEKVKYDEGAMMNSQFYAPYTHYPHSIFAVAGNHDGKDHENPKHSAIGHFLSNFCSKTGDKSPDNQTDDRHAMQQPYPYWRLDTHLAVILGLYTNVANGGILDNPHEKSTPQYDWLVTQLKEIKSSNEKQGASRAVLIAVHYPPYSAATNFVQRGDPTLGPTGATSAVPMGTVLQNAFKASGQWPDAVFCAHAHLYQRLTYTRPTGNGHPNVAEIPYLIIGSGGHTIEDLGSPCAKGGQTAHAPFPPLFPPRGTPPAGEKVALVRYEDTHFGFMRVTLTPKMLTGEYFIVYPGSKHPSGTTEGHLPRLADAFQLDLTTHKVTDLLV